MSTRGRLRSLAIACLLAGWIAAGLRPSLAEITGKAVLSVLLNKGFAVSADQEKWLFAARTVSEMREDCDWPDPDTTAELIRRLDSCYINHRLPLYVVTDTLELSADLLAPGTSRTETGVTPNAVTLFGTGYLHTRLFLHHHDRTTWQFSVRARHHIPPPVILEIWLEEERLGQLLFDKGDNSWETMTISATRPPGSYNLYVWYVNDLVDPESGIDRNAYIESLRITRQK